ncbi:ferritin-like domain-containing protein [Candidatus Pantoea carbekii]|uniref:ferritin-like domain-containing protein n=1 Tax=Candidatus Pantoea carbekii TaxID=1235990 RepID=UPI0006187B26|nr:DUF892 family protein [Candidatus Pantoea carbekii]AKC32625.1 YciE [Candidatus Pantoea carbekii]
MSHSQALRHYHDWLKDAHAMEKQAETMLGKMADRLQHYHELKFRIQQHIIETRQQQNQLENILNRYNISHSSVKEVIGKMFAIGQAIAVSFAEDEIVKGTMSCYVFENAELASYTSLIAAATYVGDKESIPIFEQIFEQERVMSDWIFSHLPEITNKFLTLSDQQSIKAKL